MNILSEEFEGRLARTGGEFTYPLFPRSVYDRWRNDRVAVAAEWAQAGEMCRAHQARGFPCREFHAETKEEGQRMVREEIERLGRYPRLDQGELWALFVEDPPIDELLAGTWHYVPNPWVDASGEGDEDHGTAVGSIAAGARFGIAPGAVVVPIATPLSEVYQGLNDGVGPFLKEVVNAVVREGRVRDPSFIQRYDMERAAVIRDYYRKADIINRSYALYLKGKDDEPVDLKSAIEQYFSTTSELIRWHRRYLPRYAAALAQIDVDEADKTLIVTAAGNEGLGIPVGAGWLWTRGPLAVYHEELRGLAFDVAALGPFNIRTENPRLISPRSNRCGLPGPGARWDPARHGRHYCITAPGRMMGVLATGEVKSGWGTSYAAPIVSGALALMKEHFRGQMTPREIGLRMVNTANNRGEYAKAHIYGAGVLDLEAALNPVGAARTGLPGGVADLEASVLQAPPAWGDLAGRLGSVEIASFDDWNAPFWSSLGERVSTAPSSIAAPDPKDRGWDRPEASALSHLAWTAAPGLEGSIGSDWGVGFGSSDRGTIDSFGLSGRPLRGSPLRFGVAWEGGSVQGAKPSGAFGEGVTSQMVFASREHAHALGEGPFSVEGSWTVLAGRADYPSSAMVSVGSGLYTAGSAALVHESGEGAKTRLSVAQPLRAESGSGKLTFPHGRTPDGEWLYRSERFRLAPDAREMRLSLHHDREVGGGRLAVEVGHAVDAGHRAGEEMSFAGLGYRFQW